MRTKMIIQLIIDDTVHPADGLRMDKTLILAKLTESVAKVAARADGLDYFRNGIFIQHAGHSIGFIAIDEDDFEGM